MFKAALRFPHWLGLLSLLVITLLVSGCSTTRGKSGDEKRAAIIFDNEPELR